MSSAQSEEQSFKGAMGECGGAVWCGLPSPASERPGLQSYVAGVSTNYSHATILLNAAWDGGHRHLRFADLAYHHSNKSRLEALGPSSRSSQAITGKSDLPSIPEKLKWGL